MNPVHGLNLDEGAIQGRHDHTNCLQPSGIVINNNIVLCLLPALGLLKIFIYTCTCVVQQVMTLIVLLNFKLSRALDVFFFTGRCWFELSEGHEPEHPPSSEHAKVLLSIYVLPLTAANLIQKIKVE